MRDISEANQFKPAARGSDMGQLSQKRVITYTPRATHVNAELHTRLYVFIRMSTVQ
jgi:hypothetical protein